MSTDYEKYIELLNLFEVPYVEEITTGEPASVLVYITENFYDVFPCDNFSIKNCLHNQKEVLSKDAKVKSYPGFYCYFSFDKESGKFETIGIYE